MNNYLNLIYVIFLMGFYACGNTPMGTIKSLSIEFDGGKEGFYKKYDLWSEITDTVLIAEIVTAFDSSGPLFICPSTRPVMWQIDVFANYYSTEHVYLFTVNSNTYNKLSVQKGGRCFCNDSLIEKMIDIAMVEKVKNFQGPMCQDDYDRLRNEN